MSLPTDILTDILRRLPAKSLIRFRCVCRFWDSFIRSPEFVYQHLRNNSQQEYLLIRRFSEDLNRNILSFHSNNESLDIIAPDLEVPTFDHSRVVVLGPCNGIVCAMDWVDIYLCNPATREFRKVPDCPFGCPQEFHRILYHSGFGYDPVTNDYKVIRLVMLGHVNNHNIHAFRTEIYNLSTNSWRELDNIPQLQHLPNASMAISFKGSLHWPILDRILCLHMNSEAFGEIEYPEPGVPRGGSVHSLAVLRNSLALISCTSEGNFLSPDYDEIKSIDVWMMKEYGVKESWIKRFSIGPLPEINLPLSFRNHGDNGEELFLESLDGRLMSCVLANCQELRKYQVCGYPCSGYPTELSVVTYSESLISIQE